MHNDDNDNLDSLFRDIASTAFLRESQRKALKLMRTYYEDDAPEGDNDAMSDLLDGCASEVHRSLVCGLTTVLESYIVATGERHKRSPLQVIDEHLRQLEDGKN